MTNPTPTVPTDADDNREQKLMESKEEKGASAWTDEQVEAAADQTTTAIEELFEEIDPDTHERISVIVTDGLRSALTALTAASEEDGVHAGVEQSSVSASPPAELRERVEAIIKSHRPIPNGYISPAQQDAIAVKKVLDLIAEDDPESSVSASEADREQTEANPEWERLAVAYHAEALAEAGGAEPEATLAMLRQWKSDAEPALEGGKVTFSRALLDSAESALEAALASPTEHTGWLPIESAPRDGTRVDLWQPGRFGRDGHRVTDAWFGRPEHTCGEAGDYCDNCPPDEDVWCDDFGAVRDTGAPNPTHWMPLPGPPGEPLSGDGGRL